MRDERGFTLIEMTIVVAIVALLAMAGGLWAMNVHPAGLRSALDRYDDAVAAARALARSGGNGATLAFEPDGSGFRLRAYRGRPTDRNALTPTSVVVEGDGSALHEHTMGSPPFAFFFGTGGHVSGAADYSIAQTGDRVSFTVLVREPPCPAGGFALAFTSPEGARVVRALACDTSASFAAAPNPTPTPNAPLLTPGHLTFTWPGAPQQPIAATEWGYTHWFASASGFGCDGGSVLFPDVLPAPFTPPSDPAEALATPLPPSDTPYSFPNSRGASMNDAPALFSLAPHVAGICRVVVRDAFAQGAGADAQVMGAIALQHMDGSPAQSIDLLLARRAPIVVFAAKTFDAQPIVPATDGCRDAVQATIAPGFAPATPSLLPARTPIALRATRAGACTLSVRSQYAGEPPAQLSLRVRAPLSVDPPAIMFAPPNGTIPIAGSSAACYARAFTDATFATPDTGDARLAAIAADGRISYDPSDACYTASGGIGASVGEPGLTPSARFVASGDCNAVATAHWNPSSALGPSALLGVASASRAEAGACTLTVADTAAPSQAGGLALKIAAGCPNAGNSWAGPVDGRCYDLYDLTLSSEATGSWSTIGIAGLYVPHGTPGGQFLSWSVQPSGGCGLTMTAGSIFAQWGVVMSNGNPQPPPVGAVTIPNAAGFTIAQTPQAIDALSVAPPPPQNGGAIGPCTVIRVPHPPSGPARR